LKLTINVTKQDILNGKPGNLNSCPIARAAKRMGFKKVSVFGKLTGNYKGENLTLDMPIRARNFIDKFDATIGDVATRKTIKPFKFTLRWSGGKG